MITGLVIKGYRCFEKFEISGLGRVTLLVGKNNSGKTCLLEAAELVASSGDDEYDMSRLWRPLSRRGEVFPESENGPKSGVEFELCHLFHGHQIKLGSALEVTAQRTDGRRSVKCEIVREETGAAPTTSSRKLDNGSESRLAAAAFVLRMTSKSPSGGGTISCQLTARGGLSSSSSIGYMGSVEDRERAQVVIITSTSLSIVEMQQYWSDVALNPEEELATHAVQILDPAIERIASVSSPGYRFLARGGMVLKRKLPEQRIPIGSMGEGIWRMLAIALSLVRARNGMLLVDDIDTGLHHTVMSDMWRMVFETARQLNVQVIATTQSSDCVRGLAEVCGQGGSGQVSLQRIEPGSAHAVSYTEKQIGVAAERNVEVR